MRNLGFALTHGAPGAHRLERVAVMQVEFVETAAPSYERKTPLSVGDSDS